MLRLFLGRESSPGPRPPDFRPRLESLGDRINPVFVEGYDAISFAAPQPLPAGVTATATAVGDFNEDGKPDVVVLDGTAGSVSVLLNTTAAGATAAAFAAPQAYALAAGLTARSVAVGDLNSDGKSDIVVAGEARSYGVVTALLSTPSPGLTVPATGGLRPEFVRSDGRLPTFRPWSVALGDFDGDGRLDLAAADPATSAVMVARNAIPLGGTELAMTPWLQFDAGPNPTALAVGDFNGDGRLDLAAANGTAGTATVVLNQTPPDASAFAFSAATVAAGLANPRAVAAADLNRDGVIDLALAGDGAVAGLANRTLPGVLAFDAPKTYAVGGGAAALVVSDFNRDTLPDIATADRGDNTVSVLRNDYHFGFRARQVIPVGANPVGVMVADFDQDGRPDLATASASGGTVSLLASTSGSTSYRALFGQFGSDVWSTAAANESGASWSKALSNSRISAGAGGGASAVAGTGVAASGGSRIGLVLGNSQARFIADVPASALAIDSLGRTWAAFAGGGVGVYDSASQTWAGLPGTAATADKLAVSANGDVFANFVGYGVYRYRSTTGWQRINGHNATSLNVDANGFVVANFPAYGVGQYIPYADGWRLISHRGATAITLNDAGTVYASFDESGGISRWSPTGQWTSVAYSAPAVSLAADLFGHFYGAFPGYGVLKFTVGIGWSQLRTTDASSLALGDIFLTDVLIPYTPSL